MISLHNCYKPKSLQESDNKKCSDMSMPKKLCMAKYPRPINSCAAQPWIIVSYTCTCKGLSCISAYVAQEPAPFSPALSYLSQMSWTLCEMFPGSTGLCSVLWDAIVLLTRVESSQ